MAAAEQQSYDHTLMEFSNMQTALTQDLWSKAGNYDVGGNTNQSEFELSLFWQSFPIWAIKSILKLDSPAALFLI